MQPRALCVRITSLFLALALLFSSVLAVAGQDASTAPSPAPVQGEIAYVLDGDLWLYDTLTGESTQLTDDGDAQWPAWSPDGMTLLYTGAASEDEMDLWAYDMATGEASLMVENACCGGYQSPGDDGQPASGAFAYLDLGGTDLVLRVRWPDGRDEVLIDPVEYGRSIWPAGTVSWGPEYSFAGLPVWAIEREAGSLQETRTFIDSVYDDEGWSPFKVSFHAECSALTTVGGNAASPGGLYSFARVGDAQACPETAPRYVEALGTPNPYPNLDAPSAQPFSDGNTYWLAAERWTEADSYDEQELAGIVLVELASESVIPIIDDGGQPVWRPSPPVHPLAQETRRPDERAVAILPTLSGELYITAFTTGSAAAIGPDLFLSDATDPFTPTGITRLLVADLSDVYTDTFTLRRAFPIYALAHRVYIAPPPVTTLYWASTLDDLLADDGFAALEPDPAVASARATAADAFRTLLTAGSGAELEGAWEEVMAAEPANYVDLAAALEARVAQADLSTYVEDALTYIGARYGDRTVPLDGAAADRLRLAAQLHLVEQRARDWAGNLEEYLFEYEEGLAAFDRNELRGLADVQAEAEEFDLPALTDALMESDFAPDGLGALAEDDAAALVADAESRLLAHAWAQALAAVGVGESTAALLYGPDNAQAPLAVAGALAALRERFQTARGDLQAQLPSVQQESTPAYNTDWAYGIGITWSFELAAEAAAARLFAAGLAAAPGLESKVDSAELQAIADNADARLNAIDNPPWLAAAVALAQGRTPSASTAAAPEATAAPEEPAAPAPEAALSAGQASDLLPQSWREGMALGSLNAPNVLQVWQDFSDPAAREWAESVLPPLIDEFVNSGQLRVEFRPFYQPVDYSAMMVALSAACVAEQNRFWPFHDRVFAAADPDDPMALEFPRLLEMALAVGAEDAPFENCAIDQTYSDALQASLDEAAEYGITASPGVVINGEPMPDAFDAAALNAALDAQQ